MKRGEDEREEEEEEEEALVQGLITKHLLSTTNPKTPPSIFM